MFPGYGGRGVEPDKALKSLSTLRLCQCQSGCTKDMFPNLSFDITFQYGKQSIGPKGNELFVCLFVFWPCWVFVQSCSSCGERVYSLVAVHGLLIAVATSVAELQAAWTSAAEACRLSSRSPQALERRLSGCGAWAQLLLGSGILWSRDQTCVSFIGRQILYH